MKYCLPPESSMRYLELLEKLKPSQYRPLVKGWDKERYKEIFLDPKYKHDRKGYRVYIPISKKNMFVDPESVPWMIYRELEKKGYKIHDYIKGIAIKTDNPNKHRQMKIGKLLSDRALNIFANDERRSSTKGEHIVVMSRHPYDIAGMSTDRGWTSCMNLDGGGEKDYVPLDIKYGSVIAYAVKNDDLNIQNPVCRIMIKPFVSSSHPDYIHFGMEDKVYGTEVPGFVETVLEWVNEVNKNNELSEVVLLSKNPHLYDDSGINDYVVSGGSKEEKEIIKKILSDPRLIFDEENPTDNMLIAAIYGGEGGDIARNFKNLSEKVQMAIVQTSPHHILFLMNHKHKPTEKVIFSAIKHEPGVIQFFKNPSEEMQLAAVEKFPYYIIYIQNPTENVQMHAIKREPGSIASIKNPTEKIQLYAVERNPRSLLHIKNPTDKVSKRAMDLIRQG